MSISKYEPLYPPPRSQLLQQTFQLQLSLAWFLQRQSLEVLAQHQLLPPHHMVLEVLAGNHPELAVPPPSGLTMSEIARALSMPPASNTAVADRLETLGLVQRSADPADRRVTRLQLTSRGVELVEQMHDYWFDTHQKMLDSLSTEELVAYRQVLERQYRWHSQRQV